MTNARKNNRKRSEAVRMLLNAAAYIEENNFPVDFNRRRAAKILLDCSVKAIASHIYMRYGLHIDRDANGHLELVSESNYHATQDGKLLRLGGGVYDGQYQSV